MINNKIEKILIREAKKNHVDLYEAAIGLNRPEVDHRIEVLTDLRKALLKKPLDLQQLKYDSHDVGCFMEHFLVFT